MTQDGSHILSCLKNGVDDVEVGSFLIYVDRDVSINGTFTDTNEYGTYKTVFQMNLKKGWNFGLEYYEYSGNNQTVTWRASTVLPSGLCWVIDAHSP
jgi:hypothetical protein